MSLTDGAELFVQIILALLMHNGKMELNMDTIDIFIMMVTVINLNFKMASMLDMFEIN